MSVYLNENTKYVLVKLSSNGIWWETTSFQKKIGQRTFWSPKKLLEDNQLKRKEKKKKEKREKKDSLKVKIQNTMINPSWKSTLRVFYKSPKTPHDWVFWKDPGHQGRAEIRIILN